MRKRYWAVVLSLVVVVLLAAALLPARKADAQDSQTPVIPKSFGSCKGSTIVRSGRSALIFESANGTIRLVSGGQVVEVYVRQ